MSEPENAIESLKQAWHDRHRELVRRVRDEDLIQALKTNLRSLETELPSGLQGIRTAGYVFAGDLESKLERLTGEANELRESLVFSVDR